MALQGRQFADKIYGKTVVNAKRRITLHISASDTKSKGLQNPGTCAAAKAAMREIPNCTMARIHRGRAYIFNQTKDQWLRYKTPAALRTEIIAFDRGGKFQPGDYELIPLAPTDTTPIRKKMKYAQQQASGGDNRLKQPRKLHVIRGVRKRANVQNGTRKHVNA